MAETGDGSTFRIDKRRDDLEKSICLLDPICGSGTYLAFAMANGMQVEGCDCKPKCIEETLLNLQ